MVDIANRVSLGTIESASFSRVCSSVNPISTMRHLNASEGYLFVEHPFDYVGENFQLSGCQTFHPILYHLPLLACMPDFKMLLQGPLHRVDLILVVEWFWQKIHSTVFHGFESRPGRTH